ncbi:hypothetical protein Vretifemale_4457 [Volvox reticuliferus]|uniref:Uncharacterized protein n=1 Tax=Volvox reticuliferus TaxID=1737510 RepID=A0A8J4C4J2_9CHLO|nr:hypothetical protein Vretifemale_4457 [Volvox reticuliferus]
MPTIVPGVVRINNGHIRLSIYTHAHNQFPDKAYDNPETVWVADTVPYLLAAPGSPLAYALRVFDDNPDQQANEQKAIAAAVCKDAGIPEPQPGEPVVRSGAHALYLTWLAAWRTRSAYFLAKMRFCFPCLRRHNKAICEDTLGDITSSLVSIAYFLELPDIDTHPYILAIKRHARDSTSAPPYESPAGVSEPMLRTMATFQPSDPTEYFSGHWETYTLLEGLQSWLMKASMSQVAWAAPGQQDGTDRKTTRSRPHQGQSPLWSILDSPGMTSKALMLLTSAWELAKHRGVGHMQHTYQICLHQHYGCKVSDSNEYYEVKTLRMVGLTFSNPRSAGGDGGAAGGGGCAAACGGGCGGCGGGA